MSNLKNLLRDRERRWLGIRRELGVILATTTMLPYNDHQRVLSRFIIAYEDRVWADRGFNGPHRPRVGESIAKPNM